MAVNRRAVIITSVTLVAAVALVVGLAIGLSGRPEVQDQTEYRAIWIATVANIDWPRSSVSSQADKQEELIVYLDLMTQMNMNAVFFQVRPHGDALYNSSIEPWSEYMTGQQGVAPDPFWDPLAFMIEKGHERGIEVHAWLNPFRARRSGTRDELDPEHMCIKMAQYCYNYGNDLWMDPAIDEVHDQFINVVSDIIDNYDVDGLHIDDYFYPWPVSGEDFPDNQTYIAYVNGGGSMSIEDWRRDNVNRLIKRFYDVVKDARSDVRVTISPSGLYRPGEPEGMPPPITGGDQYSLIYADPKLWLIEGWLDILIPQIYWNIDSSGQPYTEILKWWLSVNPKGKLIVPGNALYKADPDRIPSWDMSELIDQIEATRLLRDEGAMGNTQFSAKYFRDDVKGCVQLFKDKYTAKASTPSLPPRTVLPEYRAVWIATVANIDWPRNSVSSQADKQEELIVYLDLMTQMNMNAVFFQVRPHGDALYNSSIEPWSEYMTGKQGVAPEPFWDPLAFMVEKGHERGIEVHAWLNPFRARRSGSRDELDPKHMCIKMPQYCYNYGSDLWMDPAINEVHEQFINVVSDIMDNYDVDGLHIDDYFYPWPVSGEDFPDNQTYIAYVNGGGSMSLEDWRRDNINKFIKRFYNVVKDARSAVRVSISPFGLYRPGEPEGMPAPIVGSDPYSILFADTKLWLMEGWLDILIPQIYWNIDSPGQPYTEILKWWLSVNPKGKLIVPGNALYKADPDRNPSWDMSELIDQIEATRLLRDEGAMGNTQFSAKYFRDDVKGCVQLFKDKYTAKASTPPLPPRTVLPEYRAVWIATVANIDWPRSSGSSQADKQEELIVYLDLMTQMNMNAVFFQVRPHGDALYNSSIEPWSEYMTGQQGVAPEPFWDPLAFMVEKGHERGIEVHAWLNPFRARRSGTRDQLDPKHMCIKMPQYCYNYGSDLWMDPAINEVHEQFINVVSDIMDNYDVDGLHIDDYFYPWPVSGEDFPDNQTYIAYVNGGGSMSLEDWRRDNINKFIKRFYNVVKDARSAVRVSISPFGLYRPGEPEGMPAPIVGSDPYSILFADTKLWLMEGWLDILIPQIYWNIDSPGQPYTEILKWWLSVNPKGKLIVPGNALYKADPDRNPSWDMSELIDQIEATRLLRDEGAMGNTQFSAKYFRDDVKGCVQLFKDKYTAKASTPSLPPRTGLPEYRAVWIATVANIDWPRSSGSSQADKQEELIVYLDLMTQMNMNAVFFQVRPHGDALYNSSIEPWSEYMTGKQGVAPEPFWDPLAFMVEKGHERGIEVHAWLNPFRARLSGTRDKLDPKHMCIRMPQYCYNYGNGLWMDPGVDEVHDHFINVVLDIIENYDVDGIHIDDYFYPWPAGGKDFPDNHTYVAYVDAEGDMDLEDWRRNNTNRVVKRLYEVGKNARSDIRISISPAGIYRPGEPEGMPPPITGGDQYSLIYADPKLWLMEGWLDILIPQIYWNIDSTGQPYTEILKWWLSVNPKGKLIVPGNALYKADPNEYQPAWNISELIDQIEATRSLRQEGAVGNTQFSAKYFRNDLKSCVQKFSDSYPGKVSTPDLPHQYLIDGNIILKR